MTVPIPLIPISARVRVRRGPLPTDPALVGRTGTVVQSSEYTPNAYGVTLDGESVIRIFTPEELEPATRLELSPDREAAKRRRALP